MKIYVFLSLLTLSSGFQVPLSTCHRRSSALSAQQPPDRRNFLAAGASAAAFFSLPLLPAFAASTTVDYKAVAADIAAQVSKTPDKGPTFVRLAWHSSGTYDKQSKDGGSGGGTIRFEKELAHGGNAGLAKTAVQWMEGIKSKYGDGLSYADLYTLGGGMYVRSYSSELDGMEKDMSFILSLIHI